MSPVKKSYLKLSKIKKQAANYRWRSARSQSTIRKKMAPCAAFLVDRHIGQKFAVFVWESDGK